MTMTSKEPLNACPQIDKIRDFDQSTEYATWLLAQCMKHYTLEQVAAHTGIARRLLSYFRHRGISTYPMQIALEIMAGVKVLEE